jgi:predicted solute-binding protein
MDMSLENVSLLVVTIVLSIFLCITTTNDESPKMANARKSAYAIMLSLILAVLWYSAVLTTKNFDMLNEIIENYTGQDYGDEDGKELEKLFDQANSIHQIDDATE